MNISIIGKGNVGHRLENLLIENNYSVTFGVRDQNLINPSENILGIKDAIAASKVIIFTIPFSAYENILPQLKDDLAGKIVVDASNPLNDDWSPIVLNHGVSAGETVANILPESSVVKAFNTVFADIMTKEGLNRDNQKVTAFIAGNCDKAIEVVKEISSNIGFDPVIAGNLKNARYLEAMAHLNIQLAVGQGGGTNAAFVYAR